MTVAPLDDVELPEEDDVELDVLELAEPLDDVELEVLEPDELDVLDDPLELDELELDDDELESIGGNVPVAVSVIVPLLLMTAVPVIGIVCAQTTAVARAARLAKINRRIVNS